MIIIKMYRELNVKEMLQYDPNSGFFLIVSRSFFAGDNNDCEGDYHYYNYERKQRGGQ